MVWAGNDFKKKDHSQREHPRNADLKNTTRRERLKSALYLSLKKRKTFFWKKLEIFEKNFSFGKCRVVLKNVKGGPFLIYKHTFCCKITKNSKGGPFGDIKKISKKSRTVPKKIQRGDPVVPSGFVSYVKNWVHERGDPLQ